MSENAAKRDSRATLIALKPAANTAEKKPPAPKDAILLLRSGGGAIAAGLLFFLLAKTVFGGVGRQGPHTNAGWLSLIITMMCLPFGSMLFALGAAKWFRGRR